MPQYDRGPLPTTPFNSLGAIPTDIYGVAINTFPNWAPLTTRLANLAVGSPSFTMLNDGFRPPSTNINNGGALLIGGTSVVVVDASIFDVDDVVMLATGEFALVTAINTTNNTLTITRGYANSTAAQQTDGTAVSLVTNTRNGAAVDIDAMSRRVATSVQWVQNIQHAYSVGGQLIDTTNYVSPYGGPLQGDRYRATQECFRDFERACYYGKVKPIAAAGDKPMMGGFDTVLVTNRTTSPTNASAYKPADFLRDTVSKCFAAGGQPTTLLVSTDFMGAFATWTTPALRTDSGGQTAYGKGINAFSVSFMPDLTVVAAPLLRPGTAICFSKDEVRIRLQRKLYDKPRGSRGDAVEGDLIMRGAIEIDNESHHAMVSGITGFAAP